MQSADRNIDFDSLDLPKEISAIIRASTYNDQIREWQEPDQGSPITSALRYESKDRPRPQFQRYEELSDDYNGSFERILRIFGFEQTSRFQMDSWEVLSNKYAEHQIGKTSGVVVSAPTGFGKTAAFMGQIYKKIIDGNADSAILVYPSRALLQDQLSRVLEVIARVRGDEAFDYVPSVGIWYGFQPRSAEKVATEESNLTRDTSEVPGNWEYPLRAAKNWEDDTIDPNLYVRSSGDSYVSGVHDGSETFDSETLILHKDGVREEQPNILLTTLESLEGIAMKPHYDLVPNADFFVFDEIHQYTGLRGSHAANIIENIKRVRGEDNPAVFIGASATVERPQKFASDLFSFDEPEQVTHLSPRESDIDNSDEDEQHFFFLLTPDNENSPGVASQYIQQALMVGHSLLEEPDQRYKALSFIDSISQINRLAQQVSDAEEDNLWRKHLTDGPEDWQQLSQDTSRVFSNYVTDPVPVYSDSKASLDEISRADIVHGTSYLEVGVDISNLKYIFQYRPPRDLASFFQRAGRAGRETNPDEKMDSFIFTCLSSFGGDTNFFYRADRFLDSNIETPLEPNNPVIDWMHNQFFKFYKDLKWLKNRHPYVWWEKEYETKLLERYFDETLEYDRFYAFLTNAKDIFEDLIGREPIHDNLLSNGVDDALNVVQMAEEELIEEQREISKFLAEDSSSRYLREDLRRQQMINFRNDIVEYCTELEQKIAPDKFPDDLNELDLETIEEVQANLNDIKEQLEELPSSDISNDINQLYQSASNLYGPFGSARRLAISHNRRTSLTQQSTLSELVEGVEYLHSADDEGAFEEWGRRHKILYYLRKAIQELKGYLRIRNFGSAHGSLPAIKALFRSAYYYNKCLQIKDGESGVRLGAEHFDDEGSEFWFVPPNYFDDAGRYFTLVQTEAAIQNEDQDKETEESVDNILGQYSPFRTEFLPTPGKVQTFQPDIIQDDGLKFNFSSITGQEHKGVKIPDRIELREVSDLTGSEANGVHPLHPDTYQLLTDEEANQLSGDPLPARIFPRQEIETEVEQQEVDRSLGDLTLADVDAKAWLEAVTLDISPYFKDEGEYKPDSGYDIPSKRIERDDTKLGYVLETRGLTWDLQGFVENIDDDVIRKAERYKEFNSRITPERVALTTAAHFLTVLVSDITGVNTNLLLYGVDDEDNKVHVFEQTQGGQGIIDLFFEQLERNPTMAIQSFYRLFHNPQVYEERVWKGESNTRNPAWERLYSVACDTVLSEESGGSSTLSDDVQEVVSDTTQVTYPSSIERISESVTKTIKTISNIVNTTDADAQRLFELKHKLAAIRVNGGGENGIPSSIGDNFEDVFADVGTDTIESVLLSPDIDDCKANLRLQQTISKYDQSDVLSHTFLEAIEDYVLDSVPQENEGQLFDRGQYWARMDGEDLVYLRWEQ